MVQDRLVPGEPFETHDLLGQERPVLAELDMPLARKVAEALVERHRPEDTPAYTERDSSPSMLLRRAKA